MPNPFAEHFRGLSTVPSARTAEQWASCAPALRAGMFFMARVEDEHLLGAVRALLQKAVEEGWSSQEWVARARDLLRSLRAPDGSPYHGAEERSPWSVEERRAYEHDVRPVDSIARLRLIFRTQSRLANGYRQFCEDFDPYWLDRYPGWRFVRQPGARTKRPDHVAHENEVRLKTDVAFWLARNSADQGGFGNPYPPFGFNSWCWVHPVSRAECEKLGLLSKGEKVEIPSVLAQWGLEQLAGQLSTASRRGLADAAVERIVRDCAEVGITVEEVGEKEDGFLRMKAWDDSFRIFDEVLDEYGENVKGGRCRGRGHGRWVAFPSRRNRVDSRNGDGYNPRGPEGNVLYAAHGNQYGHVPGCPVGEGDQEDLGEQHHGEEDDEGGSGRGLEAGAERVVSFSRGSHPGFGQGGSNEGEGGVGRRIFSPEECRKAVAVVARTLGVSEEEAEPLCIITIAQLQAVEDGRKAAFLEAFPELMSVLSSYCDGVRFRYVVGEVAQCIYHVEAVRGMLDLGGQDAGTMDQVVRRLVDSGESGELLGYGHLLAKDAPGRTVRIYRNGTQVSGFIASADIKKAQCFAHERTVDFRRAFPNDEWVFELEAPGRGNEEWHAAHCNQYGHVPGCPVGERDQEDLGEQHHGEEGGRADKDIHAKGGVSVENRERQREAYAETFRRFKEEAPEYEEEELKNQALLATAQLMAVRKGRKPAYLETDVRMVKPLAEDLPEGLVYCEEGFSACIYHKEAARAALGLGDVDDAGLDAAVREVVRNGNCGLLLGYGMASIWERPCHLVTIFQGTDPVTGFHAPADERDARKVEEERLKDFREAFPNRQWRGKMEYVDGQGDHVKGSKRDVCKLYGYMPDQDGEKEVDRRKRKEYNQRDKGRKIKDMGKITEEEASAALKEGRAVLYNSDGEPEKIYSLEETLAERAEWDDELCMPKRFADLRRKHMNMKKNGNGAVDGGAQGAQTCLFGNRCANGKTFGGGSS